MFAAPLSSRRSNFPTVVERAQVFTSLKPNATSNPDRILGAKTKYYHRRSTIGSLVFAFVVLPRIRPRNFRTVIERAEVLRPHNQTQHSIPPRNSDREQGCSAEGELLTPNCSSFYHQSGLEYSPTFSNAPRSYLLMAKTNVQLRKEVTTWNQILTSGENCTRLIVRHSTSTPIRRGNVASVVNALRLYRLKPKTASQL